MYFVLVFLSECGYFKKGGLLLLCASLCTELRFENGICSSSLLNRNGSEEFS